MTNACRQAPKDRPRVVFAPDWRPGNPYQDLLASSVESAGWGVVFAQFRPGPLKLYKLVSAYPGTRVIHLHWLRDLIAPILWSSNARVRRLKLLLLAGELRWLRARGVRVVWTIHNLVEHESPNVAAEIQARRVIATNVGHLILHSHAARHSAEDCYGVSLQGRSSIIPLGNYDGCYRPDPARTAALSELLHLSPTMTVVLFFGAVRPYKGIERLIDALRRSSDPNLRVLLVGRALDPEYEQRLRQLAAGEPRLLLSLEFIPDSDVWPYFDLADVVALPFTRILTSSSAVLAMTRSKALLLPSEAKDLELVDERGARYFTSEDELVACLDSLDKDDLSRMGRHNRSVADELDWSRIGQRTTDVYRVK